MRVFSRGIVNWTIEDRFGSKGMQFTEKGMPNYSLPIDICDAPKGTVSFSIIMEDRDAIPVCGFSWIHWTVADLKKDALEENESISNKEIIQGVNSYHSCASDVSVNEATGYGGPDPPNGEHVYEIAVYALDKELRLKNGFHMNELWKAMDGHVLASATVKGRYSPRK